MMATYYAIYMLVFEFSTYINITVLAVTLINTILEINHFFAQFSKWEEQRSKHFNGLADIPCPPESVDKLEQQECSVGKYVTFGSYPQTASGIDNTPIEWLVLENDGQRALLISRYALACRPYSTGTKWDGITWKRCTLRGWLNNEFYNRAFSKQEKRSILKSDVNESLWYSTKPGKSTKDNVFLLSITEAEKYFESNKARKCIATDYAIRRGAHKNPSYKEDNRGACWWWLRSSGYNRYHPANIFADGSVDIYYIGITGNAAVRPCIWVRPADIVKYVPSNVSRSSELVNQSKQQKYSVGECVTFGSYPQMASGTDNTPIEWLVLENDGQTALLISRCELDCQPYNTVYKEEYLTWEECTLRGWLNNEFYNRAFSPEEKQRILKSNVSADKNPWYPTDPGNATKDNVFLLGIVEVMKYFNDTEARICEVTEYVIQRGAFGVVDYKTEGIRCCCWWLRSSGRNVAAAVKANGYIDNYGVIAGGTAVRPCVRVRLF